MFKTDAAAWLPREPHSEGGVGWEEPHPHQADVICMLLYRVNYLFPVCGEGDTAEQLDTLSDGRPLIPSVLF